MKSLGVLSPVKNSTVSLDLLNLYVVNQISCQKKTPETERKPIHVNMKRDIRMPLRKHDLELPMSPPRVPSNLCIDDIGNNIHYQRLGSKEELNRVQSSQAVDSCRMFKPRFNRTENYSFTPPSFSAELSSNRHITKQNFIPRIALSPQRVAYEEKQNVQISNVNYSNSLFSKLNESQDAFSPSYKRAEFGTIERLNSPGNRNFLTGRPDVVMSEDCGNIDERRQLDLITENQSVEHIWGENRKEVSNFLEDVNQLTPNLLPEKTDSFIHKNMINLLSTDQQRIKDTFDKCGYESMREICAVTSSDRNHPAGRYIRSIFTDPELTFGNSNFNKTSYPEKCYPNKNYLKEYNNHESYNLSTNFEKDCYPASSEKGGKFESDYQQNTPQREIQKYPVNHMGTVPLGELHSKQSWNFGLGEVNLMEGGKSSTRKLCQCNNCYSSQSSQSASYSPRPTESCFSSSSEMLSEDEDQILQQIEDSRRSIETEATNNFYSERMAKLPRDWIIKDNGKIHKKNENSPQFSMKNNTDQLAQPQCNSTHILQNTTSNNCILQVERCDAWVQTESEPEPVMEKKIDAAIQCDIISECKCRSDVSFLCNVERYSENIKAGTTGGQEILKNN
ncbi:regulator of DNA class I crossover intermediates 1 isoform 1-T2 [Hipposideros larvatus]